MMNIQQDNPAANPLDAISNTAPEHYVNVGETLREARERLGLSVSDVVNRIKFTSQQIEDLEAEAYDRLPEAAFLRGFVRSYARMLELDPAQLLASLPASRLQASLEKPAATVNPHAAIKTVIKPGKPDKPAAVVKSEPLVDKGLPPLDSAPRKNPMLLVAGLLIVFTVVISGVVYESSRERVEDLAKITLEPLELPIAVVSSPSAPAPATEEGALSASAPAVTPEAIPQADEDFSAGKGVKGQEHELRFEFSEKSWIEVKDSKDNKLVTRNHGKGSLVRFTGKGPLFVTVGNARAVKMYDNGKLVNFEQISSANVARITLK